MRYRNIKKENNIIFNIAPIPYNILTNNSFFPYNVYIPKRDCTNKMDMNIFE
jgi:hypothetical protein